MVHPVESLACYWCKKEMAPKDLFCRIKKLFMTVDVCSRDCFQALEKRSKTATIAVDFKQKEIRKYDRKGDQAE